MLALATAAAKLNTMATALLVLVVIVAAAATAIEAADDDKKSNGVSFSLKILLRNLAQEDVTLKLLQNPEPSENYISANTDTAPVLAQTGQWAAIGAFTTESTVVHLSVTVENSSRVPMKKMLAIDLLKHFRFCDLAAGESSVVLTALESWKLKSGKYLVIKLGLREVVLSFKM